MTSRTTHNPLAMTSRDNTQARADLIALSLELVRLASAAHESVCLDEPAEALGLISAMIGTRADLAIRLERLTRAKINT